MIASSSLVRGNDLIFRLSNSYHGIVGSKFEKSYGSTRPEKLVDQVAEGVATHVLFHVALNYFN